MTEPWTFGGESVSLGRATGTVILVEETSFCLSGRSGDIHRGTPHGLFFLDTRLLSRLELSVNGEPPEPLTVSVPLPFAATFVGRVTPRPGRADSSLLVLRRRYVGRGMREDVVLRNHGTKEVAVQIELRVGVDFADLFAVKESRVRPAGEHVTETGVGELVYRDHAEGTERAVHLRLYPAGTVEPGLVTWHVRVPAGGEWATCLELTVETQGTPVEPRHRCGTPVDEGASLVRLRAWHAEAPRVVTDFAPLREAVDRSIADLGSLRLFDPERPGRAVVAAGAPWFMTLFGRDSLLTAYMSLIADPTLAVGVLETLAGLQGTVVDPATEEEPGRILHEVRPGAGRSLGAGATVYYGTVDATPLFVVLLGELRRWGLGGETVQRLLPHADRALEWVERYGDRDGDGFVEYERLTEHGLANQGWKDSWDGIPFADGELARPPIALAEVQGYVYAAYLARSYFADEDGDAELADHWRRRAADLRERFNERFWIPERGYFALALDGDKRPVDALASNMGQCLWTGIVDAGKAGAVARHLLSPQMFSGWGVRTLATSMASYNPLSYHCGSVWPHDNALIVAGLVRYSFLAEAHRVAMAMLAAAAADDGRLPELFAGLDRHEVPVPVPYPTSCSPQAWAAAAPLEFLRLLLRLDPAVPHGSVRLAPALPAPLARLHVTDVRVGSGRMQIRVDQRDVAVNAPDGLAVVREARSPEPRAVRTRGTRTTSGGP
ncbi:MAG TPA: glycogen debranching N-terminal domain-containing protein [Mycobacteriales bacterium]|nr:glycogen debranching N-terminal domain-containing protein [Mycobacteriales bacterium]